MTKQRYELVQSVAGFDEGDVLDVTARFGDWHCYDVRIEPVDEKQPGSLELTEQRLDTVATRVEASA